MATRTAEPLRSAGAREERRAVLAYLRRKARHTSAVAGAGLPTATVMGQAIEWMLARQKRYDARVGGLGKK